MIAAGERAHKTHAFTQHDEFRRGGRRQPQGNVGSLQVTAKCKRLRKGVVDFRVKRRPSRFFSEPLFPPSRRQFRNVAHRMIVDPLQHVDQIRVRINGV